ncbi:hypothetical protein BB560_001620 [Smittium megazygosporum]|uniref:Major facilitator superfamily (MFS) profile domain-containing protein n=1 Tax=Smittium megazygosporum TaxID=133381 RepID=A0A2T9ZH23_9FUNG|nr:hypothetical protein BB560_001620 [Smittium megazygosporum]
MDEIEKGIFVSKDIERRDGKPADYKVGIPGKLELHILAVVITELCERYTFYGNTMMLPAYFLINLNLPRSQVVVRTKAFSFMAYGSTILGSIIADQWLGKFKTLLYFSLLYFFGTVLTTISSVSFGSAESRKILFYFALYPMVALGTGGIKGNVSSFVGDQVHTDYQATGTPGVYRDPGKTIEKCYRYFYWAINMGALLGMIACPLIVKHSDYPFGFMSTSIVLAFAIVIYFSARKRYTIIVPKMSPIAKVSQCVRYALKNKDSRHAYWLDAARGVENTCWDDRFVDGLASTIRCLKVFAFFPAYWLLYNNITDNIILQAMRMRVPRWIDASQLNLLVQIAIIILIPIYDKFTERVLNKRNVRYGPIKRITTGFIVIIVAYVYMIFLQKKIYSTGPYYDFTGNGANKESFNDIAVWWQIPIYILIGSSEVFTSVTGLEYAFSQAPEELKSIMAAAYQFTNCCGSLLGLILYKLTEDPTIMYLYIGETSVMVVVAIVFWFMFRRFDTK